LQWQWAKVGKQNSGTRLIIPNAGADILSLVPCGCKRCLEVLFQISQPGYAMGEVAVKSFKNAMTITWKYAAGDESVKGFLKRSFEKGGGRLTKQLKFTIF
jgi:branched-chain amino acid transport system substrate-binding protein